MAQRAHTLLISESEFQDLVREALDGLPEPYAGLMENVAVIIEEKARARYWKILTSTTRMNCSVFTTGSHAIMNPSFRQAEPAGTDFHLSKADPPHLPHKTKRRPGSPRHRRARDRTSFRAGRRRDAVLNRMPKKPLLTRPTLARQDAPFPRLRTRSQPPCYIPKTYASVVALPVACWMTFLSISYLPSRLIR